jgi:predicted metal-dependent hydrolase
MSEALFQYKIRISPKAKNPRLRVTVQEGLEIIVPKGFDQAKISKILTQKKHWIRNALEKAESNRKFIEPEPEWRLPMSILLPATKQEFFLESRSSDYDRVVIRELVSNHLLIFGQIEDPKACMAALRRWLHRHAKEYLIPMVKEVSERTGLSFSRVFIKRQKTRWASCSKNKAISLNAKLLFLEPELVEYCMIHELCHVVEMNHSKRFWALVRSFNPEYLNQDRRLRDAWRSLPRWV